MSNYMSYGISSGTTRFCESADPVDLTNKCNAIIQEQADTEETMLASFDLAGAGDGYTFMIHMVFIANEGGTGVTEAVVAAYMAADDLQIPQHRAAAVASLVLQEATNVQDEPLAGASKGTRFMGVIVTGGRSSG